LSFFFWSFYCLVLLLFVFLLSLSFFFWSFYCLFLLLFVIVLSCPSSFGHCIVLSFLVQKKDQKKKDKTIEWQKEGQDNKMTKRRRTRQYNDQKKKGKTMQWPKEEG
jgi:hypothetical protein